MTLIASAPHRWHVERAGDTGPIILLLHGAGASADSWEGVIPRLADHAHVIAIDLPGQGRTRWGPRGRCGLNPMAEDIAALMATLEVSPDVIVGHSAGGALALRLAETTFRDARIIGFNVALAEFPGLAGILFPALAKLMSLNPFTGDIVARMASNRAKTQKLLVSTGGPISDDMVTLYHRLITNPRHVEATLAMMAQWKINPLRRALASITAEVDLIAGEEDGAVPAKVSAEAAEVLPNARYLPKPALGHLAHEQDPEWAAGMIIQAL